ncbi:MULTISPECIES: J domain-containing protein [unclassified Deinococcus]|uniref:J domain-containing protein n=1 Tax=unclassified Deinococcus TaxID=2623546 RepID=UPI001C2FF17C|nr:J domain-containing protein [Deinococcus sp. 43]MDK2014691.1 J domain-containing protein [Deinococcus sp. 43]
MNYFQSVTTADELKALYRQLCKTHHPDKGGTTEAMQDINSQYEAALTRLLSAKADDVYGEGRFYRSREQETEVETLIRKAIEAVAHLDGIELEIIGAWVWLSGDTRTHKDTIKAAGYWWMNKKQMWAFKGKTSNGRGNTSLEEMRERYGSERVSTGPRRLPAA